MVTEWRIKDRQRTVIAAIVLCLNIGVDPPDVIKTRPCAKLEAWIDPMAINDPKKSIDQIGKQLQSQYELLSTRTKYKQSLDPNVEDIKKFCQNLRKSARDERILFHYNGHGVPRPTASGEIWVFNRGYTQYIPVSIYDLQTWLGAPCIYACDCHGAGHIVNNFQRFIEKRKRDESQENGHREGTYPAEAYENCILLAACRADEVLPMHPDLPADLFTCCITSPIEIAVRWFVMQSPLKVDYDNLKIPGRISDRRTPLGELNWIFTAITDTIAWSSMDGALFKRLFRQDLVVAAMFRNFLLAERIMRVHNCHPVSLPALPETHNHPMWDAWDMAVHHCLVQLPLLHAAERGEKPYTYKHTHFFEQQLTAFEYWLKYKSDDLDKPPEQLPVLLQVLLSQLHRLRALILLSKYLDLGPKAVHLALSIGIFPYVLKLLQSPAPELKPVLVFIWARIMAVDSSSVQAELVKENGYAYFIHILVPQEGHATNNYNVCEHLAMCAFVISLFVKGYRQGQKLCTNTELFRACLTHITEPESPLLRQWACLCLSQLWNNNQDAKLLAIREDAIEKVSELLEDPVPEVRTSCIVALTTFLGIGETRNINDETKQREISIATSVLTMTNDASCLVRKEVVVFFSRFIKQYLNCFLVAAFTTMEEEVAQLRNPNEMDSIRADSPAHGTVFASVWKVLLVLSEDPYPEISDYASDVVDYVMGELKESMLSDEVNKLESYLLRYSTSPADDQYRPTFSSSLAKVSSSSLNGQYLNGSAITSGVSTPLPQTKPNGGTSGRSASIGAQEDHSSTTSTSTESRFASTLRRSVSFAASLKNYALGTPSDHNGDKSGENLVHNGSFNHGRLSFGESVTTVPYGSGKKPHAVRGFSRTRTEPIELPLCSGFFEWSCEYFQEPQMSPSESDEPGSERYVERMWKKGRNERIIAETQVQKDLAARGTWNTQVGFLNNVTQPTKLIYAQFEPHLVAVDDRDGVTVWDWTESTKLNRFCNGNPAKTRITEAKLLNEDDHPMLLTGSSEGVVRLYRHYQSPKDIELACSWRVLSDLVPANKSTGLIAEWQQSRGSLLVGGDVRVIKLWDATREVCISDIPARSGSPVTSLTSDQLSGNIIVAGFGNGALRVYDRRLEPRESLVRTWKKHDSWVVKAHMQRGGSRELVSGSTNGQVHLWDIRASEPVVSFQSFHGRGMNNVMRAMDVHEHAPVIATSSHSVGIFTTNGVKVSTVRSPASTMLSNNRNIHVSALGFHPHRMGLAVNNGHDAHISVFEATKRP